MYTLQDSPPAALSTYSNLMIKSLKLELKYMNNGTMKMNPLIQEKTSKRPVACNITPARTVIHGPAAWKLNP